MDGCASHAVDPRERAHRAPAPQSAHRRVAWPAVALLVVATLAGRSPLPVSAAEGVVDANLVPIVAARLLDTRAGPGDATVDGEFQGLGKIAAGEFRKVTVVGRGGVVAGAESVMLNVTAIDPDGPGYLTVYPCTPQVPNASHVNYSAGDVTPNAVLAKLSADGSVCVFSLAAAHVAIDVNGYVPPGGAPLTVDPARLVETRSGPGHTTIDGESQGIGRAAAGATIEFRVTGRGGVPAGTEAVFLNVTAIFPAGPGFLTVFPCGSPVPDTSNVNYSGDDVRPNAVLATVGIDGRVCIFSSAAADIAADVNGYLPPGGARAAIEPVRCADTRPEGVTFDGLFQGDGPIAAESTYAVTVAGRCGIAPDASAVYANVTAVLADAAGFLTVWPCDQPRPNASNVNYRAGEVSPNAALSKVSLDGNGQICVYSSARTDAIVDVTGYVPVAALRGIADISVGTVQTCALLDTGAVVCWGTGNPNGYPEPGDLENRRPGRQVALSGPATEVVTSRGTACATLLNRTVECWGDNSSGQLGDGTGVGDDGGNDRLTPVPVQGLGHVEDIGASGDHWCAVTDDHKIWCWGYNAFGQVGDGTTTNRLAPVEVQGLAALGSPPVQVETGFSFSCALLADGTVACWVNAVGTEDGDSEPRRVVNVANAVQISSGVTHTCALIADGTVTCWGPGVGLPDYDWVVEPPVQVPGVDGVTHVSAGAGSTCVTGDDHTGWCWGVNNYGGLGNGAASPLESTPVRMTGYTGTIVVAKTGYYASCALLVDRTAVCWGQNVGFQLGGGHNDDVLTPVVVGSEPAG